MSKVGNQLGEPVVWCPKCRTKIYRDLGCNHMTCSVCKHYFCYICKSDVGRCFCDAVPVRSRLLRYSLFAIIATIAFASIPMILTLALPVFFIYGCWIVLLNHENIACICFFPGMLCAINCACILNVLAVPCALCLAPSYVIIYSCYSGYELLRERLGQRRNRYHSPLFM